MLNLDMSNLIRAHLYIRESNVTVSMFKDHKICRELDKFGSHHVPHVG